jgi:hypothetical protein
VNARWSRRDAAVDGRVRVRSSSGLTLVDSLIGLAITVVLIGPVLAGVFLAIRVGPSGGSGSVISEQQRIVQQNFGLNVAASRLRQDWANADIVKLLTADKVIPDTGLDCDGESASRMFTPGVKAVATIQGISEWLGEQDALPAVVKRGFEDTGIDNLRAKKSDGSTFGPTRLGMTRVVYNLVPEQGGGYSLVRRQCAVPNVAPSAVLNNQPALRTAPLGVGELGQVNQMPVDWQGWRIRPGSAAATADRLVTRPGGDVLYDNPGPATVLSGVASIIPAQNRYCNNFNPDLDEITQSPNRYSTCDVTLEVTFTDGRTEDLNLYQGEGSKGYGF